MSRRAILVLFTLVVPVLLAGCNEEFLAQLRARGILVDEQFLAAADLENAAALAEDTGASEVRANDPCARLLAGPPRGLTCIHCLHENSAEQREQLVSILEASCVSKPAINFLADGSFGTVSENTEFFEDMVDRLTSNGRQLYLYFYLGNGPAQRRSRRNIAKTYVPLAARLSPEEFRAQISSNPELQSHYQGVVVDVLPAVDYASARGASVTLFPFLEDNLTDEAFDDVLLLASQVVPDNMPVRFGRNACEGCYSKNQSGVPAGVLVEKHTESLHVSLEGHVITNDGHDFYYDGAGDEDVETSGRLPLSHFTELQDRANTRGNSFLLWSARNQGLGVAKRFVLQNPDDREFVTLKPSEQSELILHLRSGRVDYGNY